LDYITNISEETSFDIMIEKTSKMRVIQFNFDEWENSKCSCRYWHKELKCRPIIVLACRLEVASYVEVAYSTPITHKRKVGRPAKNTNCLQRQGNELQPEPEEPYSNLFPNC